MNNFITKLNKCLNNQLQTVDFEEPDLLKKSQRSILCIKNALNQLKAFILEYSFSNEAEEIYFFKNLKPELFSKLIYFTKIYNIESRRPSGRREIQEEFLREELEKITSFFKNHLQFYQYYRMNSNFLDDKCFLRGKEDIHLFHDSLMYFVDPDFSTSHDHMVAEIMSNDMLEVFLNTELEKLSLKTANPNWGNMGCFEQNLHWTDSKTSLIELIYALHAAGVLNNGKCDIRQLTTFFEQAFNMQLADVYGTFNDIKIRKNPTKFIDFLKDMLLRKMEEERSNVNRLLIFIGLILTNFDF